MATNIKSQTVYVDYEEFEGDTLEMSFTWKDGAENVVDLTGYTAKMDIKTKAADAVALLTLTSLSGITLSGASPNIFVSISDTQTATLGKGKYVYDIQLQEPSGKINTLIAGNIVLIQSVTQPA